MDKKISQLIAATTPLVGNELLPVVQGGVTKQITSADLSGAITITKVQFDTLVSTDGLVPGTTYSISGVDTPLYGGTTIIIKAATTNKLELAGHGIFYNPKYLNSQATPNNGYGIWQSGNTYAIGDDAIWGGKHWTNKTGVAGSSVDKYTLDSTNWDVVAFNSTDYNVVADVIHYDQEHDMIIRRKDKWDNDVDGEYQSFIEFSDPNGYGLGNPIKDFQWGNGPEDWNTTDYLYIGVKGNYVKDSYLECINFIGSYMWNNTLLNLSLMYNNTTTTSNSFDYNFLNNSQINNNILDVPSIGIYSNYLFRFSRIRNNTDVAIDNNRLHSSNIQNNITTAGNGSISRNDLFVGNINTNEFIGGDIEQNIVATASLISNNVVSGSSVRNNTLYDNSSINANTISNGGALSNNTLSSSNISSNLLDNGSVMIHNKLQNLSTFDFSSSGALSGQGIAYIEANYANATFNISAATIIYGDYSKQMFRNSTGTTRLAYYNASDVLTVVNVNA
jgi:hypothetical protein